MNKELQDATGDLPYYENKKVRKTFNLNATLEKGNVFIVSSAGIVFTSICQKYKTNQCSVQINTCLQRMEKISKEEESVNNTESGQEKHEEEAPEKESKDVEEKTDSAAQQNQDENGSNSGNYKFENP